MEIKVFGQFMAKLKKFIVKDHFEKGTKLWDKIE